MREIQFFPSLAQSQSTKAGTQRITFCVKSQLESLTTDGRETRLSINSTKVSSTNNARNVQILELTMSATMSARLYRALLWLPHQFHSVFSSCYSHRRYCWYSSNRPTSFLSLALPVAIPCTEILPLLNTVHLCFTSFLTKLKDLHSITLPDPTF